MLALSGVAFDVRNQREIPRSLDCGRKLALMSCAGAAQAARENLPVIGDKPPKGPIILVVNKPHTHLAERAGLLWATHQLFLVIVIVVATPCCYQIFLGHGRSANLVLVE